VSESVDETKLEALEESQQHPESSALPSDEMDLVHFHREDLCDHYL
jgi:hypothetical protein